MAAGSPGAMILALVALVAVPTTAVIHAPHANFRLDYEPLISAKPVSSTFVRSSTNKAGRLYTVDSSRSNYSSPVQVLKLKGSPAEVGEAYGELLADQIKATYSSWYPAPQDPTTEATLDWLWKCSLEPQSPRAFVDELDAIEAGGLLAGAGSGLRTMVLRVLTGSTMPADANNIQILIERGIAAHGKIGGDCHTSGTEILRRHHRAVSAAVAKPGRRSGIGVGLKSCDFFAAWGSRTPGGRLISTRNLDIVPGTGISNHKLVAIYDLDTDPADTVYATVGFAGYLGGLAGMSSTGITVSEANLDNAEVSFDGIAWPLRLRQLLGTARNLTHATALWMARPNTAAFNFLVGSGRDARAVALETNSKVSATFYGASAVEAACTFGCAKNGSVTDGHQCSWPNSGVATDGEPVAIGEPIVDGVFRSNHALDPRVMLTQEPLWNNTVMRYLLLHDRITDHAQGQLGVKQAVGIMSLLGIKGEDYGSCAPENFQTGDPTHTLSVVYDPAEASLYAAWEDGVVTKGPGADWRPAACQEYLWFNMSAWW